MDASRQPDFDLLGDAAQPLLHAHALYLMATRAPAPLQGLVQRGEPLRHVMYADAMTQVKRGTINADALREVKRTTGHRILLTDLQILHPVYSEKLPELQGTTTVTREELDEVLVVIDTLAQALGQRAHAEIEASEAPIIRGQALVLLLSIYEEIRAGVLRAPPRGRRR